MHLQAFVGLACTALSLGAQVPLRYASSSKWDLTIPPNVNATGHLVFATASTFLQHWPHTRYRNGHNIVPGTVPPGTLLSHGRGTGEVPDVPEWVATDPEHSVMFCRGSVEEGCWFLTLVTTRPLRVLYFDGSSAAKMLGGPMDSQDLIAWGRVIPDKVMGERERIQDLCKWGEKFDVDGFVRMEMDFEIMLCNFTNGVDVASMLNLESTGRDHHGGGPGGPGGRSRGPQDFEHPSPPPHGHVLAPEVETQLSESVISGTWHDQYPGDMRIRLDYSRMVSFYDTSLAPSLVAQRFGQPRLFHRLDGIDPDELQSAKERIEILFTEEPSKSGIDWSTLMQVIIDRFSTRIEDLQYYLNATSTQPARSTQIAKKTQKLLDTMVRPYIIHSLKPAVSNDQAWASPVFKLCATTHTSFISQNPSLTPSEHLLLDAVEATNHEICRVVVRMWAQGVEAGLDNILKLDMVSDKPLVEEWSTAVDTLKGWLDWGVWLKCHPACDYESICYLPTWPFFGGGGRPGGPGRGPGGPFQTAEPNEWEDPQPRCVRRIESLDSE